MSVSSTLEETEVIIEYTCGYEPEHVHELPDDWQFGGPDGLDPKADPRWKPTVYTYFDDKLFPIHVTTKPFCDDEAIDDFTLVASWGQSFNPVWIQAKRLDGTVVTLPVTYNKDTDEVFDKE